LSGTFDINRWKLNVTLVPPHAEDQEQQQGGGAKVTGKAGGGGGAKKPLMLKEQIHMPSYLQIPNLPHYVTIMEK
jgi:hypothetical protein